MERKLYLVIFVILIQKSTSVSNLMNMYSKFEISKEINELSELLYFITMNYLRDCSPYILYDEFFYETHLHKDALFKTLNKLKPIPSTHGFIEKFNITSLNQIVGRQFCYHYIIFSNDEELAVNKLNFQLTSKVVVVSTFSKYQLTEFLASPTARNIMNLLMISDPLLARDDFKTKQARHKEINLYTHKLHIDGIGSSALIILSSWKNNKLTRPQVNLFPPKLDDGFNGHQLTVSVFEQPPFVYRRQIHNGVKLSEHDAWDGKEIRLLKLIAKSLNFGMNIVSMQNANESTGAEEVISAVSTGKADIGISGLYITRRHYDEVYFSLSHVQDCAVFITLSSTAIPKYRAILGPFQFAVWLCVIFLYLSAVIPLSFFEKLSCKAMFKSWAEVSHMFWMIFGTFTNLFTFKENSWNKSKKNATCVAIGTYWVFTIIITAAYSSSIISFITIPTYFDMVENIDDLVEEDYRVAVADSRDWKVWFNDTKDYKTNKLVKHMDVVNTTVLGMINVRKKEKYALLGSEHQLTHIVRTNFSDFSKKKSVFHIASQCVAPFMVSFALKKNSDFLIKIDQQIQRLQENGLIEKIKRDLDWDIVRSSKGRLFAMGSSRTLRAEAPEDRQLTVDDMQGMFLLLGIGLLFAGASLMRECWNGYKCCDKAKLRSHRGTPSVPSINVTPCDDMQFENSKYLTKISDTYRRAISASISVRDFVTEKLSDKRRLSH